MNKLTSNPVLKVLAFFLCAVSAAAAFWSGLISLKYLVDDVWSEANYFSSNNYYMNSDYMAGIVQNLQELRLTQAESGLTYSQQERLSALLEQLDPANTNYRYELHLDTDGSLIDTNLEDGERLVDLASGIQLDVFSISVDHDFHQQDDVFDRDGSTEYGGWQVLRVWTGTEYLEFDTWESPPGYNEYGWFNEYAYGWNGYDSRFDSRVTVETYALRAGVLRGTPVDDAFQTGLLNDMAWRSTLPTIGIIALVSLSVFLVLLVYLFCAAGHKAGVEGISLGLVDRIPLDLYAVAVFFLLVLVSSFNISISDALNLTLNLEIMPARIIALLAASAVVAAFILSLLLTTAVRIKTRNMLAFLICVRFWNLLAKGIYAVGRGVKGMFRALSMNTRLVLVFGAYLLANACLAAGLFCSYNYFFYFIGLLLVNGTVLLLAVRWVSQWRLIRENTRHIVGGDSGIQIDTRKMYRDLREHAEQLNDLGTAIDHAVDERMKSEHFKAELITNVSHDLKTPLTSIINYVDLLKKLDIDDPKAREYLEVLDRKGQRLKKLTEDLVEASKASTGNVTVNAAQMDLVQFTQQAVAEYEDRLVQQRLTLITKMADHPVYISADGRHMWRILDNLLGNCVKYTLEGTRIYLDVVEWDGKASISIKNISRDALDMDPETLTERFVRGDESRTTEGSGLGLSIARSLTEVQGGTFRIATDGDLFKATVYFPVVLALEEGNL